ncbi:MAG TPA: MFS transporter [Acidimicrobiales bacterium]|nr:MFS transporter [Acidimicrobiales bacterium]
MGAASSGGAPRPAAPAPSDRGAPRPPPGGEARPALSLHAWNSPPVVAVGLVAVAIGFGQFGAVAALGDVAKSFGHMTHGTSFSDQAGLSGTMLGIGLAVLRLASLGGLPLAGLADRFGRRSTLVAFAAFGLLFTVLAALSPSYWWFVAIFALGRPLLSAGNGVASVSAAELTPSSDRTKAVAMIAAGYGVGAGITALIHSAGHTTLGFRGVFALAAVPLVLLPLVARRVREPERYEAVTATEHRPPVLGPVARPFRRRLLIVAAVTFAISIITGPANSFVFLYAQNVRHQSGLVTSAMVVAAGFTGLLGLLAGRALADRLGRRPAVAIAMVGLACFGVLTYSGSTPGLLIGYVAGVLAGGVLAPGAGALVNELFPTAVRASVSGWTVAAGVLGAVTGLLVFGALADANPGNAAGWAAAITFFPMLPAAALLAFLPETKGLEPEQLWAEPGEPPPTPS